MIRGAFFTIICASLTCAALAQNTFMRYYSQAGGMDERTMHELSSGNVLVGFAYNSGISLIDRFGNILHTRRYLVDTFKVIQAVRRHTDNDFAFVGIYSRDTCDAIGTNPAIGRIDSLGNIIQANYYSFNVSCSVGMGGDLEITASNDVVAWGRDWGFFALRVGPTGDVQWAKRFQHRGGFNFIKELPGGDLLAGFNTDTAGACVARLDATGNFIWCKSYIRPRAHVTDVLIEDDESFILTGYTDSIASTGLPEPLPPTFQPKLFLMKLNGIGEVQWCKGYDSGQHLWYTRAKSQIRRTLDGNYVVLANLGWPNYHIEYRPFLMKTDQNGDTLWTRSVGRNNQTSLAVNLMVCSDGGYMHTGVNYSSGSYLFKTDPLGNHPCYNRWHQVVVSNLFPSDSSFTMHSVDGATMHPAYVTVVENPPINVVEECATEIVQPNKRPSGLRVRPNPNTGLFTLSFADPLMAESYYSVYDTMGKLLFQRPLPQGKATEEVDLSRFGAGTYVVRVTSKEGSCDERVVVE